MSGEGNEEDDAMMESRIKDLERRLNRLEVERKDDESLLSIREVAAMTTLSTREIQRREADGRFPAALKIGEKRKAWRKQRILRWITEQQKQQKAS